MSGIPGVMRAALLRDFGALDVAEVPTPVPVENFERIPVITSGPYEYGVPNAPPVADFAPSALPAAGS